jgi:hypothetical protein
MWEMEEGRDAASLARRMHALPWAWSLAVVLSGKLSTS